jgi:poly-beta-1,6-N-acetyl-D-glucosamine synthase
VRSVGVRFPSGQLILLPRYQSTSVMNRVCEPALWVALFIVAYAYVGYPLLLMVWSRVKNWPIQRSAICPSVSVVIAARNESSRLTARVENCLQLDYPTECLEVIVVSDGSTDGTVDTIRRLDLSRVRLVVLDQQVGKAAALNAGAAIATGDILLFADARQRFAPDVLRRLTSHFADPVVGAVTGELILEDSGQTNTEGVGFYWKFEKAIRSMESSIDSVVGVTGAIYAMRARLYKPLRQGTILDDLIIPMGIVMDGFRVVLDRQAVAFDQLASEYQHEFHRKVRTLAGNYQALVWNPVWLNPIKNRLFFQVMSHKVSRLMAPFALVAVFILNLGVLRSGYLYLFVAQVLGYVLALIGWGLARLGIRERVTGIAFSFCLLNWAAVVGAIRFISGGQNLWRKAS